MEGRLLIRYGSALLASVLLLAAVSLGLDAGRRIWRSGSVSLVTEPVQQTPTPLGQQPEQSTLSGRVWSIDPGGLQMGTRGGLRYVLITPETQFQWQSRKGQPPALASYDDVWPGVGITVSGRPSDDGWALVADVVEIPRPLP
jgi:hypothetical protein